MKTTHPQIVKGVYNLQPYEIDYSLPPMEIMKNLPEGMHAEVIDDVLYVEDPPTPYHQRAYAKLSFDLTTHVNTLKLGEVWLQPVGVFLEGHNGVVLPDLIFVSGNNTLKVERRGLFGVPDLLIELLSPSTRNYDLTTKKRLYERTGVREVWFVDPDTKNAQGYLLENNEYGEPLLTNSEVYIRILRKTFKF